MNKLIFLVIGLLVVSTAWSQDIEVYDSFDQFESKLIEDPTKVYVVNYWATWCAPCVKELPHFEALTSEYKDTNVEVVLVSIDFKNQHDRRLVPFLKKKKYTSRLIHLADPKANDWIGKVDPSWEGTIPATLFVSGEKRHFVEKSYETYDELHSELESFIQL